MFAKSGAPVPRIGGKRVVLGIDPGQTGALVLTDGEDYLEVFATPMRKDDPKRVDFRALREILKGMASAYAFVERAVPMAMGSGGAFTYGRGFEALLLAVEEEGLPLELVEPSKWAREMHEGTSADLRPKARSVEAVQKILPRLARRLPRAPKTGKLKDGPMDALLIAAYGLRQLMARLGPAARPKRRRKAAACLFCGQPSMVRGKCARFGCNWEEHVGEF